MDTLQALLNYLKESSFAQLNSCFSESLNGIDKYFETDEQKAYFLGYLVTDKILTEKLPKDTLEIIVQTLKNNNLQDYFSHELKPEFENIRVIGLISLIVGIVVIFFGLFNLINNNISIGVNMRYLTPVVSEGGSILILGLIFFIGGIIRYRYELKMKKFMESFENDSIKGKKIGQLVSGYPGVFLFLELS